MSTVADLWEVQCTDLAIERLQRRLQEIEQQLGETEELRAARQRLRDCEDELQKWRERQRALEVQARDLEHHIRSAEQELLRHGSGNPRELEAMEANVASLKRRRGKLDDQILEAMIESERCQQELERHQAELRRIEEAWQVEQTALASEREAKTAQLQKLAAQLKHRWAAISLEDRELYRNLRSRKAGHALALVQQNTCQLCGMGLPTGVVQQARAQQRVFCPTCGRLLYSEP